MNLQDLPVHHAILIENNNRTKTADLLFQELQKLSPIHTFFNHTVLDIESARSIIAWANTPYNEEKIALVSFNTIGIEAQNALLKMLEEPRDGVRFILITTNSRHLIPTVLSRVRIVRNQEQDIEEDKAILFLETAHKERMKLPYSIDILSRVDEEERKDRESIKGFIISLLHVLEKNQYKGSYIQETLELASYASDPSVSGKALLEYLSLLLPQIKR